MTFKVKYVLFLNVVLDIFWLFVFNVLLKCLFKCECSMFQICYEFNRIVGKNLSISFLQALDQIAPNMIEIFKKKTGTMGQKLNQIILEAKVSFRSVYFILFVYLYLILLSFHNTFLYFFTRFNCHHARFTKNKGNTKNPTQLQVYRS